MVPESNRKAGPFTGTGQTQFDFDFYMLSADDVVVIVADADEKETTLSKDAYTCTLNSDQNTTPGGRVTLKTALASGHKLAICSGVPYTQNLNLTMYGNFNPTSINKEEDRRVIQIQQLKEKLSRAVTTDVTDERSPREFTNALFAAKDASEASAQRAADSRQACEEIKQNIFQYSWDIPHVVNTLRDVENYPYDGMFAVAGFGNPGQHGEDISNRLVRAEGSTELRTLGERFADVVNVKDFGAVGDGVTDDTDAIQAAINLLSDKGGGVVYLPAGTYIQSQTLVLKARVKLLGDGKELTTIEKARGANVDALKSDHFDDLKDLEDQQASELFPRDMGLVGLTFQGRYLANDVTSTENSYINTSGDGIKIIGTRLDIDCAVLNQAGVGVFIEAKGSSNQSDKRQDCRIRLEINTSKWENFIFNGPGDIFIDTLFAGNAGARDQPGSADERAASPTFGDVNGGVCDNVVFQSGAEVGIMHAWGSYKGVGVRCMSGRFDVDFLISESNVYGHFVAQGDSYGTISKLLCHGGGGGGGLANEGEAFPDIYLNSTNNRGFYIGTIFMYCRSNVDNGQDKIVVDGPFNSISDIHLQGYGCQGNGLVNNGNYNVYSNFFINNLSGTDKDGNPSAAFVRNAPYSTSMVRVNGMALNVPMVFRSIGNPRSEDIHIAFTIAEDATVFSGDGKTFGYQQHWQIHGMQGTQPKGMEFKTRVSFNPKTTDEQILTVNHGLITAPSTSDVILTVQDTGSSVMQDGQIQYLYVKAASATQLTIALKMATAASVSSSPYITVHTEI